MMKKFTLFFVMAMICGIVFSQTVQKATRESQATKKTVKHAAVNPVQGTKVIMTGDFENAPDFDTIMEGWGNIDVDTSLTYGFTGITFDKAFNRRSFIVFNPASTVPPMTDNGIQPHGGAKFGACFAATNLLNDDWLITPIATLAANSHVKLWVKSFTNQYGPEEYEVFISTTTQDIAGMTTSLSGGVQTVDTIWTELDYDLSAYSGNACIGIHCTSADRFIFMVDDITIEASGIGIEDFESNVLSIYPNPVSDYLTVNSENNINSIRITNLVGDIVYSNVNQGKKLNINTSDYSAGMYFIQLEANNQIMTKKFQVVK